MLTVSVALSVRNGTLPGLDPCSLSRGQPVFSTISLPGPKPLWARKALNIGAIQGKLQYCKQQRTQVEMVEDIFVFRAGGGGIGGKNKTFYLCCDIGC